MITEARRFMALPLTVRLDQVRAAGEYLGSRRHGGHQIHLYRMGQAVTDGFYCEVWMRLGLQYVEWIELATNEEILCEYVKLDTRDLLGG